MTTRSSLPEIKLPTNTREALRMIGCDSLSDYAVDNDLAELDSDELEAHLLADARAFARSLNNPRYG